MPQVEVFKSKEQEFKEMFAKAEGLTTLEQAWYDAAVNGQMNAFPVARLRVLKQRAYDLMDSGAIIEDPLTSLVLESFKSSGDLRELARVKNAILLKGTMWEYRKILTSYWMTDDDRELMLESGELHGVTDTSTILTAITAQKIKEMSRFHPFYSYSRNTESEYDEDEERWNTQDAAGNVVKLADLDKKGQPILCKRSEFKYTKTWQDSDGSVHTWESDIITVAQGEAERLPPWLPGKQHAEEILGKSKMKIGGKVLTFDGREFHNRLTKFMYDEFPIVWQEPDDPVMQEGEERYNAPSNPAEQTVDVEFQEITPNKLQMPRTLEHCATSSGWYACPRCTESKKLKKNQLKTYTPATLPEGMPHDCEKLEESKHWGMSVLCGKCRNDLTTSRKKAIDEWKAAQATAEATETKDAATPASVPDDVSAPSAEQVAELNKLIDQRKQYEDAWMKESDVLQKHEVELGKQETELKENEDAVKGMDKVPGVMTKYIDEIKTNIGETRANIQQTKGTIASLERFLVDVETRITGLKNGVITPSANVKNNEQGTVGYTWEQKQNMVQVNKRPKGMARKEWDGIKAEVRGKK